MAGLLTITGTQLTSVVEVDVGTNPPITQFVSQTDSQIVVDVPHWPTDTYVLTVKDVGGVVSNSLPLTLVEAISITAVSPQPAPLGDLLTITGTGLMAVTELDLSIPAQGPDSYFLANNGQFTSQSATQIVVRLPTSGFPTDVTYSLTATGGTNVSNGIDLLLAPVVFAAINFASASPDPVGAGEQVTLSGTGFTNITNLWQNEPSSNVDWTSTIVSRTDTQLVFTLPLSVQGGVLCYVTATDSAGHEATGFDQGNFASFTVSAPVLTSVSPATGAIGDTVTITGQYLLPVTGVYWTVGMTNVNGSASGLTATSLQSIVPAGLPAGGGHVSVTSIPGNSNQLAFSVTSVTSTYGVAPYGTNPYGT